MARSLDIETLIEDAFVSMLPAYVQAGTTVKAWDDVEDKAMTPVVKVKATLTDQEPGTINILCAFNVLVDIAVFTSRKMDENGRTANAIRGQVRKLLNQLDLATMLNSESPGLLVYNNGTIPQASTDDTDGKVWQKQSTILIVATTN